MKEIISFYEFINDESYARALQIVLEKGASVDIRVERGFELAVKELGKLSENASMIKSSFLHGKSKKFLKENYIRLSSTTSLSELLVKTASIGKLVYGQPLVDPIIFLDGRIIAWSESNSRILALTDQVTNSRQWKELGLVPGLTQEFELPEIDYKNFLS